MKPVLKKEFDAVAESRKWRERTSALLAPMTTEERIQFLGRRLSRFPKSQKQKPVAASS